MSQQRVKAYVYMSKKDEKWMRKKRTVVIAAILIAIIIIAVLAFYFYFAPEIWGNKAGKTPYLTVQEKMERYVDNWPVPNPWIAFLYHYCDRYFDGLRVDSFDDAFHDGFAGLSDKSLSLLRRSLQNYKDMKTIVRPIIPEQYYDLPISATIDPEDLADDMDSCGLAEQVYYKDGEYEENPGLERPCWTGDLFRLEPDIHHVGWLDESEPESPSWNSEPAISLAWQHTPSVADQEAAPEIRPGNLVGLTGANFYDIEAYVVIRGAFDWTVYANTEAFVRGDTITPLTDDCADWSMVQDHIDLRLPDLETGFYTLQVIEHPPESYPTLGERESNYVLIEVPPPRGVKYSIRAQRITCEDETNPECISYIFGCADSWACDEIFATFAIGTGEEYWGVETEEMEFDDDEGAGPTSHNLPQTKSGLFGPGGTYKEVEGVVTILVYMIESDTGDAVAAGALVTALEAVSIAAMVALGVAAGYVGLALAIGVAIGVLIYVLIEDVVVGDDVIVFTEDELYYLTETPTPEYTIIDSPHFSAAGAGSWITMPSGVELRVPPTAGYFEGGFTEWRYYKNPDEPSEYHLEIRVQRQS